MTDNGELSTGVWASYGWDWNAYLIGVYPSEVEALRAAVANSGYAVFLPWGKTLAEAEAVSKAQAAGEPDA